jgi:NitT/TauT family transport system permease protein
VREAAPGGLDPAGIGAGPHPRDEDTALCAAAEAHTRARARRRSRGVRIGQATLALAILAGWTHAAGRWVDPLFISTPQAVLAELVTLAASGQLTRHLGITLVEVLAGYAAGGVAGVGLAFLVSQLPAVGRVIEPFVVASYAVPRVALAPLIVMWFGIGLLPKIVLAGTLVFFLVFMSALAAFRNVSPALVGLARVMGASRRHVLVKIVLWSAMPYLLATFRLSLAGAVIGAIIGEFISANRGLGYLISAMSSQFNTAGVFAGIASLMIVVATLDLVAAAVERHLLRWQPRSAPGRNPA